MARQTAALQTISVERQKLKCLMSTGGGHIALPDRKQTLHVTAQNLLLEEVPELKELLLEDVPEQSGICGLGSSGCPWPKQA